MPRKPSQAIIVQPSDVTDVLPALAEGSAILNAEAAARAQYGKERDLVNQLLGQAQMADSFAKFSKTVFTSKLAYVKENKIYQSLGGKKTENGLHLHGTWDEFCTLLGVTPQHANDSIANLHFFGEEALDSMSRMGIGYRELRQFRRLPADSKTALIEAAKTGDTESLLDLAEELIARQAKEKEALTKRAETAEADLDARSQVLAEKSAENDKLKEAVTKARRHIKAMDPADVGEAIRAEATHMAGCAEVQLLAMAGALSRLAEHSVETGVNHGEFASGLLFQIEMALHQLRNDYQIKDRPDGDERPEWLRDFVPTSDTVIAD